jgi:hypothetical protein
VNDVFRFKEKLVTRVVQRQGEKGSLKWVQRAINLDGVRRIDDAILPYLKKASKISWCSPLQSDDMAEYRDSKFLEKIGAASLVAELSQFWPSRGPQWDALGVSDVDDIILVEAKAHIQEMLSAPSLARPESLEIITRALNETSLFLKAKPLAPWTNTFYQLANRLAHLYFLRKYDKKAWLVLVSFVGDVQMNGPSSQAEWEVAYKIAWHILGIPYQNPLQKFIVHIYPDVRLL